MLVIRLARVGRKGLAIYRIVAADSRRPATGKFVEILGNYNPHTKEISLKKDEISEYIKKGAQPSSAVVKLLKSEGIKLPKWAAANLEHKNKKPKTKEDKSAEEAKPAKPAEKVAEAAKQPDAEMTDSSKESAKAEKPQPEAEVKDSKPSKDTPAEAAKPEPANKASKSDKKS